MPDLYGAPADDFVLVTVPRLDYLGVSGQGDPNTIQAYSEAVEALYAVSYALKFASKNQLGNDYVVPPLEGLWWSDAPEAYLTGDRDSWQWTMMIMTPEWISADLVDAAIATTRQKKDPPALDLVTRVDLDEGRCLQILHIGPYTDEAPTIARLHNEHMPALGLVVNGHHHEIYLSDARRTDPERLRTILRQPVTERA